MAEEGLSFEAPEITREEVVNAFRPFVSAGIRNPDNLVSTDPQIIEARRIFDGWYNQQQGVIEGDDKLERRFTLSMNMLWIDAGFNDPYYLDEILNYLKYQDLENAEDQGDEELVAEIKAQIARIEAMLPQN